MFDRWRIQRAQGRQGAVAHPWETKGGLLYHIDLGLDLVIRVLSMAHVFHVWWLHGLTYKPMDAVLFLDIRSLVFAIHGKIRTYAHYCSATHNLQHNFPNALPSQLQSADEECAICKEHMKAAKVLPCGHIYHLGCLRDWLQQSGTDNFTCPICRTPLFVKRQRHTGFGQGRQWRLTGWLRGLWRPAPYTYLDQASASLSDPGPQLPPTSAFHVTQESAVDPQLFQAGGSHATGQQSSSQSDLLPRAPAHDSHDQLSDHQYQQQDSLSPALQQSGVLDFGTRQQIGTRQTAMAGDRRRGSAHRWHWLRRLSGSEQRVSHSSQRRQQDSESQREVLRNVKAVVPYLSDEVILAELECTTDANQAVENLLSRM